MIKTRKDLQRCLKIEREFYFSGYDNLKRKIFFVFTQQHAYLIWKYVRLLRICEYLLNSNVRGNKFVTLLFWIYERKRNKLGNKIGLCITPNIFDEGLFINHIGDIIINAEAKVGKNCHIHGDCCIGNTGFSREAPSLGDNVDLGWGCIIRGGITIADNVTIGANSVVTKSIAESNSVWVGAPAHMIR